VTTPARIPFAVLAVWLDGARVVMSSTDRSALFVWRDGAPTLDVIDSDGVRVAQVKVPPLPLALADRVDAIESFIAGLMSGAAARKELPHE
jgi:hypothetical protein